MKTDELFLAADAALRSVVDRIAPDDLDEGAATQVWLAVSEDPKALVTGQYLHHHEPSRMHPDARRTELQDRLVAVLERITGVALPSAG